MEAVGAPDDGPAVLVSPLAGADTGLAAATLGIAHAIADTAVELPAKFGFLVDGGGAFPLTGISLDITLRAADGNWFLNGAEVPAEDAASRAIALAQTLAHAPRAAAGRAASARGSASTPTARAAKAPVCSRRPSARWRRRNSPVSPI